MRVTDLTDEQLTTLGEEFGSYAAECESAMRIALAKIMNAHKAMLRTEERSPFDAIDSRVKTFESTLGKCDERGYKATIEIIKERIKDIAGIRIVTPFKDDIYTVVSIIEHIPGINVVQKKDYIKEPKDNGYMSIHLGVQIEIYLPSEGSKLVPVEIQVRDKAMDLWATVEHILRYKNTNPSPEVYRQFKAVSELLDEFDRMAIQLRDFEAEQNIKAENTASAISGLAIPATKTKKSPKSKTKNPP